MKLNPYDTYTDAETKHQQVVYLALHKNEPLERIKLITGYVLSTVKQYIKLYVNLLKKAIKLFDGRRKYPTSGRQLCYLMKFYDKENNLLFSKVGTTTRSAEERLKEHIKYYTEEAKPTYEIGNATIESVVDCGEIPAEGAECKCKEFFIRKFPKSFRKNDRFLGIDISIQDFERLCAEHLA